MAVQSQKHSVKILEESHDKARAARARETGRDARIAKKRKRVRWANQELESDVGNAAESALSSKENLTKSMLPSNAVHSTHHFVYNSLLHVTSANSTCSSISHRQNKHQNKQRIVRNIITERRNWTPDLFCTKRTERHTARYPTPTSPTTATTTKK